MTPRVALAAAFALIAGFAQTGDAAAQTTGVTIENIAYADYLVGGLPQPTIASPPAIITVQVQPEDTDSDLVLLRFAPGDPDATGTTTTDTAYSLTGDADGVFVQQSSASSSDGTPIDTSSPVPLAPVESMVSGEPLFIQVTDAGANLDPDAIDTILVVLTVSITGDQETLLLYETGPDTGVFIGHTQTVEDAVAVWGDGVLSVQSSSIITATYRDAFYPDDVSIDTTLVDPYGWVFDSGTGELIDGAEITLIDADTGLPAEVLGADRVSTYPSTVISGAQAIDSGGTVYNFGPGEFRFPVVESGFYILRVIPPGSYEAPSTVSDQELQRLTGAPFMLGPGARGEVFELTAGPSVRIDIPLDLRSNLQLRKTASELVVGAGDFIRYELELTNSFSEDTPVLTVVDRLPKGFRYQDGSLVVDGVDTDADVSGDGRTLTFVVPALGVGEQIKISYVVEVTVGASLGQAVNSAFARGAGGFLSNVAEAEVRVADEFMRRFTTIVGRVSAGACNLNEDWPREIVEGESIAGVRIYLEDGTFVVSDVDGLFHFRGITPGVHVVQIDTTTLPAGYEPVLCEENSRIAGRPTSRMVDLQGGSLWRADFYLRRTGDAPAEPASAAPTEAEDDEETSVALVKKYDRDWLAQQNGEVEWVYPDLTKGVPFPGVKFAVKHAGDEALTVLLEGQPISPLHIAGVTRLPDGGAVITHWRGVDIKDGPNRFTVITKTSDGVETARFDRIVYYVTEAAKARFMPDLSVLKADGRTAPEIAIRFTDAAGRPVHRGRLIEVEVEPPHRSAQSKERFDARPLTEGQAARTTVIVGDDGVAMVRLEPTLRSGAVRVVVKLDSATGGAKVEKTIDAWLKPEQREWILVGLAEGTVAFNTISGKMRSGGGGSDISTDGRVAFFAKGTIKGEWLLTIALDTARRRGDRDEQVFRQIDPNAFYTLYGDAAEQDYEGESRYPLYVKLERTNFYALFGDYDVGMNQTDLTQYNRRLSGLKVAYRDETFDVVAFGTETNQAFVKEEFLSNGTSGPYRLKSVPLVRNSEKVVVETRDRFRNDIVLSTRTLVRYLDYSIDYDTGILTLRQPVPVTDDQFNPNVLAIDYEAVNPVSRNLTYGGRAAVKLADGKVEIGASYVHEGGILSSPDSETDLGGVDIRVALTENTELKAEYARSRTTDGGVTSKGEAILIDVTHQDEDLTAHAYFRQEDAAFGLGQQSAATGAVRRYGAEGSYVLRRGAPEDALPGTTSLSVEMFREESLDVDATRTVAEATIDYTGQRSALSFGVRRIDYEGGAGQENTTVTQFISSASYSFENTPLTIHATSEFSFDGSSETDFDSRFLLGADYRFTEWLTAFTSYEFGEGAGFQTQNIRAGLSATPWKGGTITVSAENQMGLSENGDRLAATVGVSQSVMLTDKLSVSAGFEHQMLLSGDDVVAPAAPFTNALMSEEFTVGNLGLGYVGDGWSASTRFEIRDDTQETRLTLNAGLAGDLTDDLSAAAWLTATETRPKDDGGALWGIDLSLAGAYRPLDRGPIYLNRLDVSIADQAGTGARAKIVNNFTGNFRLNERGQASIHIGAKYAMQDFDGQSYDSFTYFAGGELRYDVTRKFDIGLHGGIAHSVNSGVMDYAFGASVGYNVFENAWLSLGYNLEWLDDDDFGGANFSAEGLFLAFRFNFDQDTVRAALDALRVD